MMENSTMRVRSNYNKNIEAGQAKATGFKPGTSGAELSASTNSGTQGLEWFKKEESNLMALTVLNKLENGVGDLSATAQAPAFGH
ncbi:hypothetical protein DSO57_1011736 [Entomophthora muscae]|uniref:Uncharacterized protein n=1 Tax=Entomophthora muscae TaxID=34485 RepID=A0ACC2T6L5_9FUNG|nr:hypothetical protein DSO57_1011736 [Entomophthora muscae]